MIGERDDRVRWITDPAALLDDDVADAFVVISTPQDEALSPCRPGAGISTGGVVPRVAPKEKTLS